MRHISTRMHKTLGLLCASGNATASSIDEEMDVSQSRNYLNRLCQMGHATRSGPGRGSTFQPTEKGFDFYALECAWREPKPNPKPKPVMQPVRVGTPRKIISSVWDLAK